MQRQSGNFLLQALLSLTLIFAFVPYFATRLAARDMDSQMHAASRQIESAQTAARIFIRETASELPYDVSVISGNAFADTLEPYGLPLGFVPRTALGQDISLVINKTPLAVSAYLKLSGGGLSQLELAELARRIGFYASADGDGIIVGLALDDVYSDIVRRNETNLDNSAFFTDLDMGGFVFDNAGNVMARHGEFDSAEFGTLSVVGTESGRKQKNDIKSILTDKAVFQTKTGESALSLTRGGLVVEMVNAKTVSRYGDTGNLTAGAASVYDFAMTAGRTSFTGPSKWNVRGSVITDKINFSIERLEVDSFINAARGQDVYINPDDLEYSTRSGIEVNSIAASNITVRDQTSDALSHGETGAVILDIRPAGTSVMPDVLVNGIDNNAIAIIAAPGDNDGKTVDCKSIINKYDGRYNQKSLAQYIICQYVYWQRLEKRINIKKCLLDGKSGCV